MVVSSSTFAAQVPPGTVLASGQSLVRNNGSEPASLDPHKGESDVESNLTYDFFEGLISVKSDGTLEPRLAARWESQDNRVWTFYLRPGVKWSDGTPVTAQDLVWSWQRLVDPATASPYASYLANAHVVGAAAIAAGKAPAATLGVKALDDSTFQVTLDRPMAYFVAMVANSALVALPQAEVAKFGDSWTQPANIVVSGAYKPMTWVVNEKIVAGRNTQYWDDNHTVINQVTYLAISSDVTDVNRYKAGEIDITSTIPQNLFAALRKALPGEVRVNPHLATYYFEFNTQKPPFNDPRVRLALNMALDKQILADKVMGQGQKPAWLISQPQIGGATLTPAAYSQWPAAQRIARARELLAQAGFDARNPLTFQLLYNTSDAHQRIAIAVSSIWRKNLGVEARLQNQEWKTMLDTMHSGTFNVVRYAWIADYEDASSFLNNFRSGDSQNTSGYSNPRLDGLLDEATRQADPAARDQLYQQVEDILAQDVPAIPVYHYVKAQLVKPWVGGFAINKLGIYLTRDMYIVQHAQ